MTEPEEKREEWSETLLRLADQSEERTLELFYARLILGRISGDAGEYIARLTAELPLPERTRRHLGGQPPARLLLYRDLVRSTFEETLRKAMPRTCARMGSAFSEVFDNFLATRATEGRCLRDLTPSFLEFVRRNPPPKLPFYLWELAELEALRIVVASEPDQNRKGSIQTIEPALERGLIFSESTYVLSFTHAVHLLKEDESDLSLPARKDTHLLAYRDREHEVRYMELTHLAARVLRALMEGASLGNSIVLACAEEGVSVSPDVLAGSARVLADLSERGALLGVRAEAQITPSL